jgi:hypothetical protein
MSLTVQYKVHSTAIFQFRILLSGCQFGLYLSI